MVPLDDGVTSQRVGNFLQLLPLCIMLDDGVTPKRVATFCISPGMGFRWTSCGWTPRHRDERSQSKSSRVWDA